MSIGDELYTIRNSPAGIMPKNMKSLRAILLKDVNQILVYFEEPDDTIVDNQLLCSVEGVKIVYSDVDYPETEYLGTVVADIKKADFKKHLFDPVVITGINPETTYYFSAFPYNSHGLYNRNNTGYNRIASKVYEYYGYDVEQYDSNPATRVSYPSDVDNANWGPITFDSSTGNFDLGPWASAFFIRLTRPVMQRYDGGVDYELNHENQNYRADGKTLSDISNGSYAGNAMVEFPQIFFKRWQDGGRQHVRFANIPINSDYKAYQHMYDGELLEHIYLPMFKGVNIGGSAGKLRSIAGYRPMNSEAGSVEYEYITRNGIGWQFDDWMDAQMITHLLFLLGKSTDVGTTFGKGHHAGGTAASLLLTTGGTKDKGAFYRDPSNDNSYIKFFWLENYYGDRWDRKYGLMYPTDPSHIVVKPYPPYNTSGASFIDTGISITGTSGGYISATQMTEYGEFPVSVTGSETMYQPDGCWFNNNGAFLLWGGCCDDGLRVGAAVYLDAPFSRSAWSVGPSLAYKFPS